MNRTRLCACLLVAMLGCKSEEGTVLQIQATPAFEDDCSLAASPSTFQGQGFYDPSGNFGYLLPILVVNNANDGENPAAIPGDPNIKPSANDAQIIGFDYCFYSAEAEGVTAYDPKGEGMLVDCDDLPDSQRGFIPSGGGVTAGGGTLVGAFTVLDPTILQVLFGETFTPALIPNNNDPTNVATRSPAWGDFPAAFGTTVTVNLRIRAKRQDGGTMRSNWYAWPVVVAPTAVPNACQASVQPCTGGGSALQGSQLSSTLCPQAFSGAPVTCEAVDLCP